MLILLIRFTTGLTSRNDESVVGICAVVPFSLPRPCRTCRPAYMLYMECVPYCTGLRSHVITRECYNRAHEWKIRSSSLQRRSCYLPHVSRPHCLLILMNSFWSALILRSLGSETPAVRVKNRVLYHFQDVVSEVFPRK